jgi:hypothetical protein
MRKGILLVALTATATGVAAAPAHAAKSWKYRADITIVQKSDWAETVRWPRDGFCGSADVHYVYKGSGDGDLEAKVRGKRTTFRNVRGVLQSSEIRVPGEVFSDATWSVARQNQPTQGCDVPPPIAVPMDGCNPLVRKRGTGRVALVVIRGRLNLIGGFYYRDPKQICGDPTGYTGLLGVAGPVRSRKDVDDRIKSKRTKSIKLTSRRTQTFTSKDFEDGFGANTRGLDGSGSGTARWTVKLTRIR